MDRNSTLIALVAIVSGTVLLANLMGIIARARIRRRSDELPATAVTSIDERLSHIEQAVDAMSVEMERISENQRFTTRLLSERATERPAERT